jgi:hypothetical protein
MEAEKDERHRQTVRVSPNALCPQRPCLRVQPLAASEWL